MEVLSLAAAAAVAVTFLLIPIAPRWGLPALVLLGPFLNHTVPRAGSGLNAETFLYAAGIVTLLFRGRPTLPPPRYFIPIVAYFGVMLLSFAVLATWYDPAQNRGIALYRFLEPLKSQVWPTLGLLIFFSLAPDETLRRRLLICLSGALLIGAASSLLTPGYNTSTSGRLVGILYRNPNEFGAFLGIFSIVPLTGIFRRGSGTLERAFSAGVYGVALVALVLTQSRGAWLACLVGHTIWLLYMNRWLLPPLAVAGFFALTTAYSLDLLPETIKDRIDETLTPGQTLFRAGGALQGALDQSASRRFVLYSMSGDMLMDSPIWGLGYRGFSLKDSEYGARYGVLRKTTSRAGSASESLYVRVAAEQGFMGLGVLGWFAFILIEMGHRLARLQGRERDLGVVLLSVVGATGTACLTQSALVVHEVALPFWMICGLAIHALRSEVGARRVARQPEELPALPSSTAELQPSR